MITIKLSKTFRGDSSSIGSTVTLSCLRYDVYRRKNSATITAHKDYFDAGGVEFQIGEALTSGTNTFDVAYVENEAGKTIDKIGPADLLR